MTEIIKKGTIISVILSLLVIITVLVYGMRRQISVPQGTNVSTGVTSLGSEAENIPFSTEGNTGKYLVMPLTDLVRGDQIQVTGHYLERELWVDIMGLEAGFFNSNAVTGNREPVVSGKFIRENGIFHLRFGLDEMYAAESFIDGNKLFIELLPLKDHYEKIIVLDVDDNAAAVETASMIREIADEMGISDKIGILYTDTRIISAEASFFRLTDEEIIAMTEDMNVDAYIRISVAGDDDTDVYGCRVSYNASYYIPEFGNGAVADVLLNETVTAVSNRGNMPETSDIPDILRKLTVPAADISIGYITNERERKLLERYDYKHMAALGICNAIKQISSLADDIH